MKEKIKFNYDTEADVLYITLSDGFYVGIEFEEYNDFVELRDLDIVRLYIIMDFSKKKDLSIYPIKDNEKVLTALATYLRNLR